MRNDPLSLKRRRPSLTPLIDVVFLLLIFFMIVSRLTSEQQYDFKLMSEGTVSETTREITQFDIRLLPGGDIIYQENAIKASDLKEKLARSEESRIQLELDPETDLQDTVRFMEEFQSLENVTVSLSSEGKIK